ncbi:L10-interacting MYB domain-containing protein-like [Malania oleifera]|uniref:L10-interacting MYB domain-containing protein-like n=1 Tax=Malania oleifera TaxID=397392 RepID=UPI0025AEB033|nr:L10-interacting MYB domain-containing protein-like [Malania oleifera]
MASRPTRSRRPPPAQQHEQQSRAKWTNDLTKILLDLMVDQVQKGNKQNKSFGKKAWRFMCDEFYEKTGLKWDKEQLKNRYAVLRRQYVTVKSLLDQNDFSWDESTGAIIAKDEAWDQYIREHPDAETIRSTGCPIYKQLCSIFTEPGMNGKYGNSNEYEDGTPFMVPCPEPLNTFHEESSSESEDEADVADEQEKFQSTMLSSGHRKRGRKGIDDIIANAILEMAAASKLRTAAIEQCNARFSIATCVKALDEMEGVDERVYFAALNLFDNPNARETFLSLKIDKRLTWLYGKCTARSSSIH